MITPKLVKLNAKIAVAVSLYYINRANQYNIHHVTVNSGGGKFEVHKVVSKGKEWDKQADIDNVGKVAAQYGYGVSVCSGTFWFVHKTKRGFEVNESTFPMAKPLPKKRVDKPV
jgi:hypothetical protein